MNMTKISFISVIYIKFNCGLYNIAMFFLKYKAAKVIDKISNKLDCHFDKGRGVLLL